MKIHSMTQKQTPKIETRLVDLQINFHAKHIVAGIFISAGFVLISFFI